MAARTAYVIGSGPNGLTAAIVLARAGIATTVLEAQSTYGGGIRSAELTLPGFTHDVCSAVHPLALSSPVLRSFPLAEHGLEWIHPPAALAHPLDDGRAVIVEPSLNKTADRLGSDGQTWRRILQPLVRRWNELAEDILGPPHFPHHPLLLGRFAMLAPWPATIASRVLFRTDAARAAFAGMAAHSFLPLEQPVSGAFGWMLALTAHAVGWPIPRGGSQRLADALVSYLRSLGGNVVTNTPVRSLAEVRDADIVLCDITPRQLVQMAGDRLPAGYRHKLEAYRYGPGVFKMDWALDGPIPWRAAECSLAATVHVCGTLEEIAASERAPWEGRTDARPFVLLAQSSLFDPSRAPAGKHTVWAYCHVPNGSTADMTDAIESQIERFAPGFGARILARSAMDTAELQRHNENLQGGDIIGGSLALGQMFFRPTWDTYRVPLRGVYLCSSSTPPGGGVHGMCGYHAAQRALKDSRA